MRHLWIIASLKQAAAAQRSRRRCACRCARARSIELGWPVSYSQVFSGGFQRRMALQPFSINRLLGFEPGIIFWHEF
jgi:hypothetical protein